jgi:hypothetical protein
MANINTTIDNLIIDRKNWQQAAYKASNDELYGLLARCFDLYLAISRSYELPKALNALLAERGYTFTQGTSLALKVVRVVFADPNEPDRFKHRLLTYARVLTIAKEASQRPDTLADFIVARGGIDEIRRAGGDAAGKAGQEKRRREHAEYELSNDNGRPMFKLPSLPKPLQPEEGERFSLALVRKNDDGTGSIVFGTGNKAALAQVLLIAGKQIEENSSKQDLLDRDAKIAERLEANMTKLKKHASKHFEPELTAEFDQTPVAEPVL